MQIYTKTGDAGETGLFRGGRVSKSHLRVEAYGEVDEASSYLGVCRAILDRENSFHAELDALLAGVQSELFVIGSDLATVRTGDDDAAVCRLATTHVEDLERRIDEFDGSIPPLSNFILPAGTPLASHLFYARTLVRRAERRVVTLSHAEDVGDLIIPYLNRLSDLLFVLGRTANHRADESEAIWEPPRTPVE